MAGRYPSQAATVAMKACLDLPWNVLANGDAAEADWANYPPVDGIDYRNGNSTEQDQPDSRRDLLWELHDTAWWNPAWSQTANTASVDEGHSKDRDLERPHYVRDK